MIAYVKENLLLKGEEIDEYSIYSDENILEIPIIKRTTRTVRKVAMFKMARTVKEVPVTHEILSYFHSIKVKKDRNFHKEVYEWFLNGWILEEIRYKKDGISVEKVFYRANKPIIEVLYVKEIHRNNHYIELFNEWRCRVNEIQIYPSSYHYDSIQKLHEWVKHFLTIEDVNEDKIMSINWKLEKRILFLHFIASIITLASIKKDFDWKEIGANYYKQIGGSKKFDTVKEEFIEQLELILDDSVVAVGLTSFGVVVPIFFTGNVVGRGATYEYGYIHATTDNAVFQNEFATDAEILWLVENRGVLTRMAIEKSFLKQSRSLVVCCDGQVRSSHANFIKQLMQHSSFIKKVMIWTDYDEAGIVIATSLYNIVNHFKKNTRFIGPNGEMYSDIAEYEETVNSVANKEQEEMLGDVQYWMRFLA